MQFPYGKTIVFEGLDSCFKETNCKVLGDEIRKAMESEKARGKSPLLFQASFPRYDDPTSYFVKKWLNGNYDRAWMKAHPKAVDSMYALDQLDYQQSFYHGDPLCKTLAEIVEAGMGCFLFDRYFTSNALYNPINGEYPTREDISYFIETFGMIKPDIVILMHASDLNYIIDSNQKKKGRDCNESDIKLLRQSYYNMRRIIDDKIFESSGILTIPIDILGTGNKPLDKDRIAHDVVERVDKALKALA